MNIENEWLKIAVNELGAELTSIFSKKTNAEHLWQGNAAIWNGQAPVLFPIVGKLFNNTLTVDGQKYAMQRHGFARRMRFDCIEQTKNALLFEIANNEKTKTQYPFDFRFRILYELEGEKLLVRYSIINTDSQEILFSVGGHPAFNVPFFNHEKYEDYYIEFDNDKDLERFHINEDGLFDGRKTPVLKKTDKLYLHPQMFADDAMVFKNLKSRKVTIRSINHGRSLSVAFPDFPYLGLWAKVAAPFVCIEPWLGCADETGFSKEFRQKEGVIRLAEGTTFSAQYSIEID